MITRRAIAAALVAAAPLAANAQTCPTSADLKTGVTLSAPDLDLRTTFHRLDDNGLQSTTIFGSGGTRAPLVIDLSHALLLARQAPNSKATYDRSAADLENLASLGEWSSPVTVERSNGVVRNGEQFFTFIEADSVALGPCIYDVWRIRDTSVVPDGTPATQIRPLFEKLYAPDLGLVLSQFIVQDDGSLSEMLVYDQIMAE